MKNCQCGENTPEPKFQSLKDGKVYNLEQVKEREEQKYYVINEKAKKGEIISRKDIFNE